MNKLWHDAAWDEYLAWQASDKKTWNPCGKVFTEEELGVIASLAKMCMCRLSAFRSIWA